MSWWIQKFCPFHKLNPSHPAISQSLLLTHLTQSIVSGGMHSCFIPEDHAALTVHGFFAHWPWKGWSIYIYIYIYPTNNKESKYKFMVRLSVWYSCVFCNIACDGFHLWRNYKCRWIWYILICIFIAIRTMILANACLCHLQHLDHTSKIQKNEYRDCYCTYWNT